MSVPNRRQPLVEILSIPEKPEHIPEFPKDEKSLGFERKPMVRWLDPVQLAQTAKKAIVSEQFATYADERELQVALAPAIEYFDYSEAKGEEFWFDYVSDVGDGFDPTYGMAYLIAKPELTVDNVATKRGTFMVLGGDEVYPTASRDEYQDRLNGPYTAALPYVPPAAAPHLFAVPGNHDWYDGLTAFTRLFLQGRWIGGWKTWQKRSYFAIKLPHDWWLWAIDVQLQSDVDQPQIDYFCAIAQVMQDEGAKKVILCSAEPSWAYKESQGEDAYKTFRFFEETLIEQNGFDHVIGLAGDVHSYARYESKEGRQRFIAGGGGAYLAATHDLPSKLDLPRGSGSEHFEEKAIYPTRAKSRALAGGAIAFALWNRFFWLLMGGLYLSFITSVESTSLLNKGWEHYRETIAYTMWSMPFGKALQEFTKVSVLSATTMLLFFVLWFGLIVYADFKGKIAKLIVGSVHTAAHIIAVVMLARWLATLAPQWPEWAVVLVFAVEMLLAGGVAGSAIFGLYYFICALFEHHLEHAFSSQGLTVYKQFIRFRVTASGIDLFTIGADSQPKWKLKQQPAYPNHQHKSWFDGDIEARLIDRASVRG